jgi:hypothetical protein
MWTSPFGIIMPEKSTYFWSYFRGSLPQGVPAEHTLATCAEQIIALLAQPNPGSAFDRLRAAQLTTTPDKPAVHL